MGDFENYEPRNYLRRAFRDQHNVILMLGALLLGLRGRGAAARQGHGRQHEQRQPVERSCWYLDFHSE